MCTYAEEAWHQEAYSEKEGGKFAEAGPPPVGSGVDTGVAGQVSQAHHPLRAARRHPRGLCAVGLFFNLLQPSLVRVLKGSLRCLKRRGVVASIPPYLPVFELEDHREVRYLPATVVVDPLHHPKPFPHQHPTHSDSRRTRVSLVQSPHVLSAHDALP